MKWKILVYKVHFLILFWLNAYLEKKDVGKILKSSKEGFAYNVGALV